MTTKEQNNIHYYLLVFFGDVFTRFILVSISENKMSIAGALEVTSRVFKSGNAQAHFEKSIHQLEKISHHKIMTRGILLVMNSGSKGIRGVSFVGSKEFKEKIGTLKSFDLYPRKEVVRMFLEMMSHLNIDFNYVEVDQAIARWAYIKKDHFKIYEKGLRESLLKLVNNTADLEKISHFLPFEIDLKELENYIANKSVYPQVFPTSQRDFTIEQGLVREFLNQEKSHIELDQEHNKIIVSGMWMNRAMGVEQIILTVIDGLALKGVSSIYLDKKSLIKPLAPIIFGLPPEKQKSIVSQVLSHEVTVITIQGPIVNNKMVGKLLVDQGLDSMQEQVLKGGEIHLLPFSENTKLKFHLDPMYGVFNSQLGDKNTKEERIFELDIQGGDRGIIIDVRGRPLTVFSGREGKKQLISWYEALDLYHKVQSIGGKKNKS